LACFEPKCLSAVWVAVQLGMPRNDPGRLPKTHKADQKWSAFGFVMQDNHKAGLLRSDDSRWY